MGSTAECSVCSLMCSRSRFGAAGLPRNHRSHGLGAPSPALQSHLKLLIKGAPNIILPWVPTASVPSSGRTAGAGLQEAPAQPEQNTQQVFTSSGGVSHDSFPVDQKQASGERFTLSCPAIVVASVHTATAGAGKSTNQASSLWAESSVHLLVTLMFLSANHCSLSALLIFSLFPSQQSQSVQIAGKIGITAFPPSTKYKLLYKNKKFKNH